jgi:hypothetical protein
MVFRTRWVLHRSHKECSRPVASSTHPSLNCMYLLMRMCVNRLTTRIESLRLARHCIGIMIRVLWLQILASALPPLTSLTRDAEPSQSQQGQITSCDRISHLMDLMGDSIHRPWMWFHLCSSRILMDLMGDSIHPPWMWFHLCSSRILTCFKARSP